MTSADSPLQWRGGGGEKERLTGAGVRYKGERKRRGERVDTSTFTNWLVMFRRHCDVHVHKKKPIVKLPEWDNQLATIDINHKVRRRNDGHPHRVRYRTLIHSYSLGACFIRTRGILWIPEGRPRDFWCLPSVWNLRAVSLIALFFISPLLFFCL